MYSNEVQLLVICDATNQYEITSILNWEPWMEGLLMSLLCGDQCHCQEVGCGNLEKWCSQSAGCKWCQMCLDDNLEFVRFTTIRELDEVSTDLIHKWFWSNRVWHIANLHRKVANECIVVCWSVKCKTKVWVNMGCKISWNMWPMSKVF